MKLEAMISVNNGEPLHAVGSCTRTMMESVGLDPVNFRENGGIITNFTWIKTHDGYRNPPEPEEPKKKPRISSKRLGKLEQKWQNWSKDQ
jgi:hypothetical protein